MYTYIYILYIYEQFDNEIDYMIVCVFFCVRTGHAGRQLFFLNLINLLVNNSYRI